MNVSTYFVVALPLVTVTGIFVVPSEMSTWLGFSWSHLIDTMSALSVTFAVMVTKFASALGFSEIE